LAIFLLLCTCGDSPGSPGDNTPFAPPTSPPSAPLEQDTFGDAAQNEIVTTDNFESGGFTFLPWKAGTGVEIVESGLEGIVDVIDGPRVVKFSAGPATATLTLDYSELPFDFDQPLAMSFWVKTDIQYHEQTKQKFTIYVDDVAKGEIDGLSAPWRQETVVLPKVTGETDLHTIRFELTGSNYGYQNSKNAVYLDKVEFLYDATDHIIVYPRAAQKTYLGVPDGEKIIVSAKAFRKNNTPRTAVSPVFIPENGTISGTGEFTPTAAGAASVTASQGSKSATSGAITVYETNSPASGTYTYPGTNVTYSGYNSSGATGTIGSITAVNPNTTIVITSPAASNFNADGFFILTGTVTNPQIYNYILVDVERAGTGTGTSAPLKESYFLQGDFSTRIWLRYGSGAYTVKIFEIGSMEINTEVLPLGAGDRKGCSYYQTPALTLNVTNTNTEADADNEVMRFIYPSYTIQSDNFVVTNIASELTYGMISPEDKIRAIHDWIIKNTVYDSDSTDTGKRKQQDAITVLTKRFTADSQYGSAGHFKAVCEGYAQTAAALLRASGIPSNFIASVPMMHAWNSVYLNSSWKFMDATWDDPASDTKNCDLGPNYVRYDYFLLDSFNGINNDHPDGTIDNGRHAVTPVGFGDE
jgi:hypothetical protein